MVKDCMSIFKVLDIDKDKVFTFDNQSKVGRWLMCIDGNATILSSNVTLERGTTVFIPTAALLNVRAHKKTKLLMLEIQDIEKHDPKVNNINNCTTFNYLSEPILESKHDQRTRIYVASKTLMGHSAFVAEIVFFPPGVKSSNHCHFGVEHFQYLLQGSGIVFLDDVPQPIKKGDLVYKYDGEYHYVHNTGEESLVFVEFFVPGSWETIWADQSKECTWSPTGKNTLGTKPTREITAHKSDGKIIETV